MTILSSSSLKILVDLAPTEAHGINIHSILLSTLVIGFWAIRCAYDRRKAYKDTRAIFFAFCILQRFPLIHHLSSLASQWQVRGSHIGWSCGAIFMAWCVWQIPRRTDEAPQQKSTFLKPCMIPCRTTHSRLYPTKHSFSYSYLYVGIPVGWGGHAGSMLSANDELDGPQPHKTWFSVAADDYLERGTHEQGLKGKLQDYLTSQSVAPDMYPYAYLVTAPRFLGFSFNPVSFWYLYDSKRSLAAMILEVNNTFDERRMYFMERKVDTEDSQELGVKFAQEWPKDFHVSPFNDRGGAYSVQSTDPFASSIDNIVKVGNNIVLKSEDGKPKLIARVFSTQPAIDASKMTTWATYSFVLRWWWVGFMTNPRILKEARKLWVKKLQVYYRPEVLSSSIGRNETPDEVKLEAFFRDMLCQMAESTPFSFQYTAAAGPSRAKPVVIRSIWADDEATPCSEIAITVLTPEFYSQLVRHASLVEAFDRHCFQAADGAAMVHCTHPAPLREALTKFSALLRSKVASTTDSHTVANAGQNSLLQPLRQISVMALRSPKPLGCRGKPSDFDLVILRSPSTQRPYYKIVLKLLLADRIAFGWLPILKLEETSVWLLLILAAASASGDLFGLDGQFCGHIAPALLKLCGIHILSVLVAAA